MGQIVDSYIGNYSEGGHMLAHFAASGTQAAMPLALPLPLTLPLPLPLPIAIPLPLALPLTLPLPLHLPLPLPPPRPAIGSLYLDVVRGLTTKFGGKWLPAPSTGHKNKTGRPSSHHPLRGSRRVWRRKGSWFFTGKASVSAIPPPRPPR